MKKFIIILISTILVVFFLAFNYLLWDRVQLDQSMLVSSQRSEYRIEDLQTELTKLKQQSTDSEEKFQKEQNERIRIQKERDALVETQKNLNAKISSKERLVSLLIKSAKFAEYEQVINQWCEAVALADPAPAYKLMYMPQIKEEQFKTQFKDMIKTIKVKGISLDQSKEPTDMGQFSFFVDLDVKLADNKESPLFVNGSNNLRFNLIYSFGDQKWFIETVERQ